MKRKRNILMCNEQLNIGGVETAVLTMCKGYIKAGCNVFVAAKDGIFREQLESIGVKILDLEYELLNRIPYEKMDELKRFCIDNEINEIHIHQYPCILYWLPICMELNIPYVAYIHSIVLGTPQWFMKDFPIYRTILPIFFDNASKILCISENSKAEIQSLFKIDENKYKIVHNCLCMDDFVATGKVEKVTNFIIVSRLSVEKEKSIKTAIDFFKKYNKKVKNCNLKVVGDGPIKEELIKYANDKSIEFLGRRSDVPKLLDEVDVLLGVDRCILEAVAMKKVAIISSYDGNLILLDNSNIELASEENFSGNNLTNQDDVFARLESIDKKEYDKITKSNYEYVNKNYNIDFHLYNDGFYISDNNCWNDVFKEVNNLICEIDNLKSKINELTNSSENINKKDSILKRGLRKIKRIICRILGR